MNFWTSFSFLRLTFYLIGGIVFYLHAPWDIPYPIGLLSLFVAVYLLLVFGFSNKRRRKLSGLIGSLALAITFLLGYNLCELKNPLKTEHHFFHFEKPISHFAGTVISEVTEKGKTKRFEIDLSAIRSEKEWIKAEGKVQIYLALADTNHFKYGDQLLINGTPRETTPPLNPNEFDYKKYLSQKKIFHQHYAKEGTIILIDRGNPDILGIAFQMRRWCEKVLRQNIPDKASQEIVVALILGIKEGLDNEIKDAYSGAGAMHVLAVSGLHVGIIFQVLSWLLNGLRRKRFGKLLFALSILAFLWFYAMLTGLSPSVMRAVTMFSLVVIGQAFSRRTNIYNTLSVAAFVLLCYDPMMITQVGFQLSFAAVFGIVHFQPKFYELFQFQNKILDAIWSITCVSLAAQLATGPISVFYFHQFPVYFWLSNLIVIPAAAIILYAGLGLLAVSFLPFLSSGIGYLLDRFVSILNFLIDTIFHLPFSQITKINISTLELFLSYGLIVVGTLFWASKKFRWVVWLSSISILLSSLSLVGNFQSKKQQSLIFYAINKHSAMVLVDGETATILADFNLLLDEKAKSFHIAPSLLEKNIKNEDWVSLDGKLESNAMKKLDNGNAVLVWNEKKILILRKMGLVPEQVTFDYVLAVNNALKNLKYLPQCKLLIVDGSNSFYTQKRLKEQAEELGVPIHFTQENGAFQLE